MSITELVILAVEDSPERQVIENALSISGFRVEVAPTAGHLEDLLQKHTPAVVAVDETLDGTSGLELSAAILQRFPTLPVMLVARVLSPTLLQQALQAGISDCLVPPLDIHVVVGAFMRLRKRANALDEWVQKEVRRNTQILERQIIELETTLNGISEGVIGLDEALQVLFINPAARLILSLGERDITGQFLLEYLSQPDLASLLNIPLDDHLTRNQEVLFDDGRVFTVKVLPVSGVGWVLTLQDITNLKMVDRIKSDFIHTVSHDLRSPLTAILGYVELLERIGQLNDQQRELVRRVQASVHSITALVNDLLDLGRIEAGFDTSRDVVLLQDILRYSLDTFQNLALEKGITLSVTMDSNLPSMRGNPIRLRQLVDNLIGNAIKYTPPGGRVLISMQAEDGQIILQVADTGVGIPLADQPRIFEKFFRASNVSKDTPGTGLGLSIVKSIVENHQGRIWLTSIPGQGSTFYVVLPVYRGEVGG